MLLVLKGQTRCSKSYDSPRGLCTGQIYGFNFRKLLVYFEFRLSSRSAMFFLFTVLLGFAKASHKRWIQFFARQVEASLVIRAAKLKFVQESRTRVSFVQSLGSTSWREMLLVLTDYIFLQLVSQHCCIASWNSLLRVLPRLRQVGHKRGSTRNNKFQLAMQQCWDKLKKNVVCITGP